MRKESPKLTVASYNVLADPCIKPEYYPLCDPVDLEPEIRQPRLVRRVRGLGTDVICLQEVTQPVYDVLVSSLAQSGYVGYLMLKTSGKPFGCATFVRRPWSVGLIECLCYSDGYIEGKPTGRVALVAHVRNGARGIAVANTHLQWDRHGTPAERSYGLVQTHELIDFLKGERGPRIVCGDLNVVSRSPVMDAFRSAGYDDAHGESGPTFNASGRPRKIDFILYAGLSSVRPKRPRRIDDKTPLPSRIDPSDHVPIVASFQ